MVTPSMPQTPFRTQSKTRWAGALLVILLARAYVPVGFMPATGSLFELQICPVGLAAWMPAHHQHPHLGSHADFENCPFGSAPAAGPISHQVQFESAGQILSRPAMALASSPRGVPAARAHLPRGPPALA
jgi:hypothetical protein